jgi:hypothetical protein
MPQDKTPRPAEEIAQEMVRDAGWLQLGTDGVRLASDVSVPHARAIIASLIRRSRFEGASAALRAGQPRDLDGRIRALIQVKAGEYADAAHDGPRSFALQETMRWLRNAYAHPHYVDDPMRVVAILRDHSYPSQVDVYLRTADELEAIVRECSGEKPQEKR